MRRVGKTTLIREFCKGKKAIYFAALETTQGENLASLSKEVFENTMPGTPMPSFTSFEELLDYIYPLAKEERQVLLIDEYPYLAQSYRPISSIIQNQIDLRFRETKLFLILCGSSLSFMENQVLGYKSPLYGRRTAQFKIRPFTYKGSALMLADFPKEEQAILCGITGAIPDNLGKIEPHLSLKENICELFLTPSGSLFEEPNNLLKQELRDPATYNAVIAAIAGGASRLNEIATKVGIGTSACSNLLTSLIALGLVKKEVPVTESRSRGKFIFWQIRCSAFGTGLCFPT